MIKLGANQANAILSQRLNSLFWHNSYAVRSVDGSNQSDELYRVRVLNIVNQAKARTTVNDVLVLSDGYELVSLKNVGDSLIEVVGYLLGTEDVDGEDAGTYQFRMNASSLQGTFKASVARAPRVDAQKFLEVISR